ncbi:hypothetical protein D3C83_16820 [compost metagenome]
MDDGRARRALVLLALVAFHAARVVVLGLALVADELDAVDAAVARVEHLEVVDRAAGDARAACGVGADPIVVVRHELHLGLRQRACREARGCNQCCCDGEALHELVS